MLKLEGIKGKIEIENEEAVVEFANLQAQLHLLHAERRSVASVPSAQVPFLQPGRLVR